MVDIDNGSRDRPAGNAVILSKPEGPIAFTDQYRQGVDGIHIPSSVEYGEVGEAIAVEVGHANPLWVGAYSRGYGRLESSSLIA